MFYGTCATTILYTYSMKLIYQSIYFHLAQFFTSKVDQQQTLYICQLVKGTECEELQVDCAWVTREG